MDHKLSQLSRRIRLGLLAITALSVADVSFGQVATPAPAAIASNQEIDPGNSVKAIDPAVVVEEAIALMKKHAARSVQAKEFVDWKQTIERSLKKGQNISFMFRGDLMADGRPRVILIRDFEVIMKTVSDRAIKLDSLPAGKVRVVQFGYTSLKQAEAYHISNVKFIRSQSQPPFDEIVAAIEVQGVRSVRDNIYIRIQFVGSKVGPIYVSLKDLPKPKGTSNVKISNELDELVRPKLWGGLCVVDVIQVSGPNPFEDFSSVSNQWIEYVELVSPRQADELVERDFEEAMEEAHSK